MRKNEGISLISYLYHTESRLNSVIESTEYRFVRRELDEVDLLEEIIAKSNYKFFLQIEHDILKILKFAVDDSDSKN